MQFTAADLWSIASSITSVILGVLAIVLSIWFFVQSRNTEAHTSRSLTKIETQAEMLQKLAGRQLDRLTRFVTDQPPRTAEDQVKSMIAMLIEIVPVLQPKVTSSDHPDVHAMTRELISCYIGLYYYSALANYWAQFYLPPLEDLDQANEFHMLVQRAVDQSAADFNSMAQILSKADPQRINENALSNLFNEAVSLWRNHVRTTTQVYAARTQGQA